MKKTLLLYNDLTMRKKYMNLNQIEQNKLFNKEEREKNLINDIVKKKKLDSYGIDLIRKEYGKVDYSFVKINYFKERAIQPDLPLEEEEKYTLKNLNVFSLLQGEVLYNDFLISKFVNFLIKDGKKYLAYRNFEYAISFLKQITFGHPLFYLRYYFYLNEQLFDYKEIISKRTKKRLFIIPKFVEGRSRWLKPLKLWVMEFFYDQSLLYKITFFRKFYLRLAFTLFRLYKKHRFFIKKYVINKHIVVAQNYKRLPINYILNKNRKIKIKKKNDFNDKSSKWNWTKGRNWKDYNIHSNIYKNEYNIWKNKSFEYKETKVMYKGAIKTNPRKLKKKHIHTYLPWLS